VDPESNIASNLDSRLPILNSTVGIGGFSNVGSNLALRTVGSSLARLKKSGLHCPDD
jgi:hypothetical protein